MWSPTILSIILAILIEFLPNLIINQLKPNLLTIMTNNKSTGVFETIDTKINNKSNSYKKAKWNGPCKVNLTETFKWLNTELSGKIFTKWAAQASIYDNSFKVTLTFIGLKYDQRVYKAFEYKDKQKGL